MVAFFCPNNRQQTAHVLLTVKRRQWTQNVLCFPKCSHACPAIANSLASVWQKHVLCQSPALPVALPSRMPSKPVFLPTDLPKSFVYTRILKWHFSANGIQNGLYPLFPTKQPHASWKCVVPCRAGHEALFKLWVPPARWLRLALPSWEEAITASQVFLSDFLVYCPDTCFSLLSSLSPSEGHLNVFLLLLDSQSFWNTQLWASCLNTLLAFREHLG